MSGANIPVIPGSDGWYNTSVWKLDFQFVPPALDLYFKWILAALRLTGIILHLVWYIAYQLLFNIACLFPRWQVSSPDHYRIMRESITCRSITWRLSSTHWSTSDSRVMLRKPWKSWSLERRWRWIKNWRDLKMALLYTVYSSMDAGKISWYDNTVHFGLHVFKILWRKKYNQYTLIKSTVSPLDLSSHVLYSINAGEGKCQPYHLTSLSGYRLTVNQNISSKQIMATSSVTRCCYS